jgi:hypothetical protein
VSRLNPRMSASCVGLWLCLLALAGGACQRLESTVLGSQKERPGRMAKPRERQPIEPTMARAKTVTLEFEVPADLLAASANAAVRVTGFQIGFFGGGRAGLVRAIELPREAARVNNGKVRLDIPLISVESSRDSNVTVHVRTLSAGPLGPWSPSAGSVTLPVIAGEAAGSGTGRRARNAAGAGAGTPGKGANRESRRKQAAPLSVAAVDGHTALKTALTAILDSDLTLESAVGTFSRTQDLAAAIVLSRKLDLKFSRLCKAIQESPSKTLAEGLKTLQPSIDATKEIRAVSAEARRLVGGRRARSQSAPPNAQP